MQCRICLDEGGDLLSPCLCRGSASYIHRTCLDQYIQYYPDRICRVCRTRFPNYPSPREATLCWIVFVSLVTLLIVSSARLIAKFALLTAIGALSFFFLRRNLFNTTPLVLLTIIALLFLPGNHPAAAHSWLAILGGIAFAYTIVYEMPIDILLMIVVKTLIGAYSGFLIFFAYHALDPAAFTVFLSVFYLAWYAWIREHSRLWLV